MTQESLEMVAAGFSLRGVANFSLRVRKGVAPIHRSVLSEGANVIILKKNN